MRNLFIILLVAGLMGVSGCATMNPGLNMGGVDKIVTTQWSSEQDGKDTYILQKDNDLYLRIQSVNDLFHRRKPEDIRLTNTPEVKETDVRLGNGYITYFSQDSNGGHWYMQPLGGDDKNRKEISADTVMKSDKIYQVQETE